MSPTPARRRTAPKDARSALMAVRDEVGKAIVGQEPVITGLVIGYHRKAWERRLARLSQARLWAPLQLTVLVTSAMLVILHEAHGRRACSTRCGLRSKLPPT